MKCNLGLIREENIIVLIIWEMYGRVVLIKFRKGNGRKVKAQKKQENISKNVCVFLYCHLIRVTANTKDIKLTYKVAAGRKELSLT